MLAMLVAVTTGIINGVIMTEVIGLGLGDWEFWMLTVWTGIVYTVGGLALERRGVA